MHADTLLVGEVPGELRAVFEIAHEIGSIRLQRVVLGVFFTGLIGEECDRHINMRRARTAGAGTVGAVKD